MIVDIVVDVGNSRAKWGRCSGDGVGDMVSLPLDDPWTWQRQLEQWGMSGRLSWVLSGVAPERRDRLADWVRRRGDAAWVLESPASLPLRVLLEHPGKVGVDRLLNAVAVNARRTPGRPAAIIDAGSAVTVDYLDGTGAFRGGAIFPGLRLMAQALHDHTALLPLVPVERVVPPPGTSTAAAIETGVFHAVLGGIQAQLRLLGALTDERMEVFLGGGDGVLLESPLAPGVHFWPQMTLEGLRLAALEGPS